MEPTYQAQQSTAELIGMIALLTAFGIPILLITIYAATRVYHKAKIKSWTEALKDVRNNPQEDEKR